MIEKPPSWVRYRHKANRTIEYDVACFPSGVLKSEEFNGELCHRVRTIRNILLPKEIHQPAYTMMPADKFLEIYEEAAGAYGSWRMA